MGEYFTDKYTLLHFAVGIVAYFWGITLEHFIILHSSFELFENSPIGIEIINTHFKDIWPGGKSGSDSIYNSIGDTVFASLGWYLASII